MKTKGDHTSHFSQEAFFVRVYECSHRECRENFVLGTCFQARSQLEALAIVLHHTNLRYVHDHTQIYELINSPLIIYAKH